MGAADGWEERLAQQQSVSGDDCSAADEETTVRGDRETNCRILYRVIDAAWADPYSVFFACTSSSDKRRAGRA